MAPPERPSYRIAAWTEDGLSAFLGVRPRLFRIACRMLGSTVEAEDVVQEAWLRWQATDRGRVRDAAAFLATTTARLAINVMQSARARRELYVGSPPDVAGASDDAGSSTEQREALELGVVILLERLSPAERAAFVLREAFDRSYRDIATLLRLGEANARQVVTRARQHVTGARRTAANPVEHGRLLASFVAAAREGNVAGLERLLAPGYEDSSR